VLWKTEELTEALLMNTKLEAVKTYVDSSHLMRDLFRCEECGHLYFVEFYEEIDWHGETTVSTRATSQWTTWKAQTP